MSTAKDRIAEKFLLLNPEALQDRIAQFAFRVIERELELGKSHEPVAAAGGRKAAILSSRASAGRDGGPSERTLPAVPNAFECRCFPGGERSDPPHRSVRLAQAPAPLFESALIDDGVRNQAIGLAIEDVGIEPGQ